MTIQHAEQSIDDGQLRELEDRLKLKLPSDYRSFLLEYNGGYPQPSAFKADCGVEVALGRLLSLNAVDWYNDLEKKSRELCAEYEGSDFGVVQIGYDIASQPIFMATRGSGAGSIYLITETGVHLVADSFSEFMMSLDARKGLEIDEVDRLMARLEEESRAE